jgi:hypothetical protein
MRISNPYAGAGVFRKAQLHCHTTESDGRIPPPDLLRMYRDAGYAFVCITDHNRVTRYDGLDGPNFTAISGVEDEVGFGLPVLGAHMGRLFVDAALRSGSAQERIDQTRAAGGVVSLCHPTWTGNLWTGAWSEADVCTLQGFHLMEIRNPHSSPEADVRRWTAALRAHGPSSPIWGVAVDDCHRPEQFDRGWIMVSVRDVSTAALRSALLGGAHYATTGPTADFVVDGNTIGVRLSHPGRIQFADGTDRVRVETMGESGRYTASGGELFVRIEADTAAGQLWSQPFWIEETGTQERGNAGTRQ